MCNLLLENADSCAIDDGGFLLTLLASIEGSL